MEYTTYGEGYKVLTDNFISLFGQPSGTVMPPNGVPCHVTTAWLGEKVYLKTYYKYLGISEGDIAIIDIGNRAYRNSKTQSGF